MSTIFFLIFLMLAIGALAWVETHLDWIRMELCIREAIQRSYEYKTPCRYRSGR